MNVEAQSREGTSATALDRTSLMVEYPVGGVQIQADRGVLTQWGKEEDDKQDHIEARV